MDKKILTVIGARPHFIKAVSVSASIAAHSDLKEVIIHTGQHYDYEMSQSFFEELDLPIPKYNLEIGSVGQLEQVGGIIVKLAPIFELEKPDLILVYGDTNSTAAAAIAGSKMNIPVGHVEAGLREFDKNIPEEVNKLLVDAVTDLFFAPTKSGVDNLLSEGKSENVFLVGDVGIDLIANHHEELDDSKTIEEKYGVSKGEYFFVTSHRNSNTENKEKLQEILQALSQIKEKLLFSIHPRTLKAIKQFNLEHYLENENIIPVGPLGFWETQTLIKFAKMVLTDSGGIIKESYFHKVPAVILDDQTEWIETLESGWHQIAGPNREKILRCIQSFQKPSSHEPLFGNGAAAIQIVEIISKYLHVKAEKDSSARTSYG